MAPLDDSAVLSIGSTEIAFTTDSYTVNPIFFPGGDIGRLAVCGTVNDLSMVGARPLYLSLGLIIEEGFLFEDMERIVESIRNTANEAGVQIVTGDTKVVERGNADGVFINTSGIGLISSGVKISGSGAKEGDCIVVSGYIGVHGMSVVSARENFGFKTQIESDVAPLNHLVQAMLEVTNEVHALRDGTRGGIATVLNEIACQSGVGIEIEEEKIPISEPVRVGCELLGYDPLYVANEGVLVGCIGEEDCERVVEAMRMSPYGENSSIIGRVTSKNRGRVILKTQIGSHRILDLLSGEQLPRIC